jgi:hypothetical protein
LTDWPTSLSGKKASSKLLYSIVCDKEESIKWNSNGRLSRKNGCAMLEPGSKTWRKEYNPMRTEDIIIRLFYPALLHW